MKTYIFFLTSMLFSVTCLAVNSVNPSGVNVNATGVTSVFLTFRGTFGQISTDAFWCGEISVPANTVSQSNPCVAGTFFGRMPKTLGQTRGSLGIANPAVTDLAQANVMQGNSVNGNSDNLTDIMTIPASVARRALQSAKGGNVSSFFYVRKFESAGNVQYIAVTCRMSHGGARVPLALTHVQPYFDTEQGKQAMFLATQGQALPSVYTDIQYNGSGRLKGRWELVLPGDSQPTEFDLVPEANLPQEQRGLQKRYTFLQRIDVFLPPKGNITIKGPDPKLIANQVIGPYQILLRIEATRDKEGDSNTGIGVTVSGGVSGFSMPKLRYYVATDEDVLQARLDAGLDKAVTVFSPSITQSSQSTRFSWLKHKRAAAYKFEIKLPDQPVFTALIKGDEVFYETPSWINEQLQNTTSRWRISAFNHQGKKTAISPWQTFTYSAKTIGE